ncbi:Gfo/Idh/MocA family oxidoreductase [Pollutibacter soli]|uniref:Gfo/Idh/MocA family protein n=1 Tax=Pollutibacter soli TaxID=3034157 RepID=UPI0030137777
MSKSPLRFGIVGCGRISQRHAEQMAARGIITGVCDIVNAKAEQLATQYGAVAFTDLDSMLLSEHRPDILAVCTPNGLHAQQSIQALEHGCHVLCEKPMAIHYSDCEEMIGAAEKANRILYIVKQNRFNPPVLAVKKILDEGGLGKLYSVQVNCFWNRPVEYFNDGWRGSLDLDGGCLYTQFSHFLDLLIWMVGEPDEVFAITNNAGHQNCIDFEDQGVVILKFKNACIGNLHFTINSFARNMEGSITLFGEKGTIKIGGEYLNTLEYQKMEGQEIRKLEKGNPANDYGHYTGSMSNHDKVYEKLVFAINEGMNLKNDCVGASQTIRLIEKIYHSAFQNSNLKSKAEIKETT